MAISPGYTPSQNYNRGSVTNIPQIPSVQPHPQSGTTAKPAQPVQPAQPSQQTQTTAPTQEPKVEEYDRGASSVTNDDTLQDGVIHNKSGKSTSVRSKVPTVRKKVTKDVIQIRDFPRDVMDIVRGIVPGGNSYVETLLAFIYIMSPTKFDIPPNVQEIVEDYMQDDQLTQVFKEIRLLREQIRNVEMTTYQTALAAEYSLFNGLGLRKDTETNPSDINYLEPGVEDMHIALEEGAKQLKKKDTIRHGRR